MGKLRRFFSQLFGSPGERHDVGGSLKPPPAPDQGVCCDVLKEIGAEVAAYQPLPSRPSF